MRRVPKVKNPSPATPSFKIVLDDLASHRSTTCGETAKRLDLKYHGASYALLTLFSWGLASRTRTLLGQGRARWLYSITPAGVDARDNPAAGVTRKPDHRSAFSRKVVIDALRDYGPMTVTQLADVSGFSKSNARTHVKRLLASAEVSGVPSSPRRTAAVKYTLNKEM